jgi:chorismate mutase
LKNLLVDLEHVPSVPENPTADDLAPWRERIDTIDRLIVSLLNERATCAVAIGEIKHHLDLPIYVPAREVDVLNNVTKNNPGPLSAMAIRRLYERLIDETRSLERQLHAERDA